MRKRVYCSNRSINPSLYIYYFVGVSAKDVLIFLDKFEKIDPQKVYFYQDVPVNDDGVYSGVLQEVQPSLPYRKISKVELVSAEDIIVVPKSDDNSILSVKCDYIIKNPENVNSYELLFLTHDIDWMTTVFCRDNHFIDRFISYVRSKSIFMFSDDESLFI